MTVGMRLPALAAPPLLLRMLEASLPAPDRAALADPSLRRGWPAVIRRAFRHGAAGPQHDQALMSAPWGFDPAALTVPVRLWQGTADTFGARPAMAEHLHGAIPGSHLHLTPDGHLSVLTRHLDAILGDLAHAARAGRALPA